MKDIPEGKLKKMVNREGLTLEVLPSNDNALLVMIDSAVEQLNQKECELEEVRHEALRIFPSLPLGADAISVLSEITELPPEMGDRTLGGRTQVFRAQLPGVGPIVVKSYSRGGALRKVLQFQFFRSGRSRPEREQEMLRFLHAKGISVPSPVAAMTKGTVLYRAWLVMRAIEPHRTLAQIALEDEDLLLAVMPQVCDALQKLLELRIFHVDLHPGNVLVDDQNKIFVIDFDHASFYHGPRRELRDRYLQRWRRAVIKHELPEVLSEAVCASLRGRVFDDSVHGED